MYRKEIVDGKERETCGPLASAVRYDRQQVTTADEKAMARENIGAAAASTAAKATDITAVMAMIAEPYDKESTYEAGDLVTYSKKLYAAKADIETAESWTAAHWEQTTLAEVIAGLGTTEET